MKVIVLLLYTYVYTILSQVYKSILKFSFFLNQLRDHVILNTLLSTWTLNLHICLQKIVTKIFCLFYTIKWVTNLNWVVRVNWAEYVLHIQLLLNTIFTYYVHWVIAAPFKDPKREIEMCSLWILLDLDSICGADTLQRILLQNSVF